MLATWCRPWGDADRLERRYADCSADLPLGSTPGEADLDRVAAAIADLGFSEESREWFRVGGDEFTFWT